MATDTARYSDLCRLCATKTNMVLGINIFERQIYKKIQSCLPIQIHEGDELPKIICENCLLKLEIMFEFRERSLRTESLLVDLFKELNAIQLQVDHQMKLDVVPLEHSDIVMVPHHQTLLTDHGIPHVNELDLTHLTHHEHLKIVGHEIILGHQNVTLENIELSNHDLNPELSNHSMPTGEGILVENHLQNGRYIEDLDYNSGHQMLNEQYSLNAITLTESSLQSQDCVKDNHHIEEHSMNSESQDSNHTEGRKFIQMSVSEIKQVLVKHEDSNNSENCLLIDENNMEKNVELRSNPNQENQEWIYCSICGSSYEDKLQFEEHYNEHFNKCKICSSVFQTKEALNVHRKEVHGNSSDDEKLECEEIKENSIEKESSDYENNVELEGNDPEEFEEPAEAVNNSKKRKWSPKVCKECGKVYKTNYKLAEHMRKHTGEQPFKCQSCDKAFRSKIGLAQHEAKHTGQYDYACLTCGKGFQCKSYLMVHQRVHSDVKPFPCTTCGRNFKTKKSLLDHTNRHLGVKPYTCEICGRSFVTNGLCKAHQKVHSGTDNRKYSCKVCNKMFVSKSYLQTHLRIHTGEKPFMCEVCGKGFLTRVDLKVHSTMHTGEKSYVCEMCGKAFARRDALRCHRRSHTGERPYSCDYCGQTFTQFSPMAIHKRLHTGERPYECETCGKKFVSRSTMMVHSKKHTR